MQKKSLKRKHRTILSSKQADGLGLHDIGLLEQQQILSERSLDLFAEVDETELSEEYDGQTYQEFLEMENEPNLEGTGRYRIKRGSNDRVRLKFLSSKFGEAGALQKIQIITRYLELFFPGIQFVSDKNLELVVKKSRARAILHDSQKSLEFPLRKRGGKLDVFSMFDVLVEYKSAQEYCLICFVEEELTSDNFSPKDTLLGQACGDGVAVVQLSLEQFDENLQAVLQTILHEFMHALGFDHCIYWTCLMNSVSKESGQFYLCPVDLLKLHSELRFNPLERYEQLLKYLQTLDKKLGFEPQIIWIQEMISRIRSR